MSYPERDIQRAPHRGHSVYTADPFPDHLPTHSAHEEHHHRRRIPTLPDLRFEYSYLRGVRSYVRVERLESTHTNEKGKGVALPEETGSEGTQQSTRREVLHVQWGNIVWATLRDQVISPFLQGALWCVQFPLPEPTVVERSSPVQGYRQSVHTPHTQPAPRNDTVVVDKIKIPSEYRGWRCGTAQELGWRALFQ